MICYHSISENENLCSHSDYAEYKYIFLQMRYAKTTAQIAQEENVLLILLLSSQQ